MVGIIIGAAIFGQLADSYGRKKVGVPFCVPFSDTDKRYISFSSTDIIFYPIPHFMPVYTILSNGNFR